jgi:hypothetical protein
LLVVSWHKDRVSFQADTIKEYLRSLTAIVAGDFIQNF